MENLDPNFDNFLWLITNEKLDKAINMYPALILNENEKGEALTEVNRVGAKSNWDKWRGTQCRQLMSAIQKKNKSLPVPKPISTVEYIEVNPNPAPRKPWGLIITSTSWLIWLAYSQLIANQVHPDSLVGWLVGLTVLYAGIKIWPLLRHEKEQAKNHLKNP
jgi:hypothetical protein